MRLGLLCAAALAVLVVLAVAFRLRGDVREAPAPERSVPAGAGNEAVELSGAAEPDHEQRVGVADGSALDARGARRASSAADGTLAALVVLVVGEDDERPLSGVPLIHLPWPPQPLSEDFEQDASVTDEHGRATLKLAPGGTQVYNLQQDDRKVIVELAAGEKREETLRLRARADRDVHLLIVDALDEAPVAGARVELDSFPEDPIVGLPTATADEHGAVALRVASWIAYNARVSAAGYTSVRVDLEGAHEDREHARRIALERPARLHGTVSDGGGGALPGVTVTANAQEMWDGFADAGRASLAEIYWAVQASSDGRYELAELPANVGLSLQVRRGEQLLLEDESPLRLSPGEARERDFVVDVGGSIRGFVLDAAGAPVADQDLWLASGPTQRELNWFEDPVAETTSDDRGRFQFERVPPGTWLIGPKPLEERPPDYPMPIGQPVHLPAGVSSVEIELRLPQELFVSGRCVDQNGDPVADAEVSGVVIDFWATAGARSATDGAFTLGPLPAGEVALFAMHDTMCLDARTVPRARAGDSDILLRFAAGARIVATVIDAESRARVAADVGAFCGETFRAGSTKPDGSFELSNVPPGRWALVARASPGLVSAPRTLEVAPGGTASVELAVAPGATVSLLLPEREPRVFAWISVGGDVIAWADPGNGTTVLVPPGPLTVELRDLNGVLATREGSAAAGETVEIDLR